MSSPLDRPAVPRVLPFLAYILVIAVLEAGGALGLFTLSPRLVTLAYPFKAGLAAVALFFCLPRCPEWRPRDLLRPGDTAFSLGIGLAVFVLWIVLDAPWARLGTPVPFMPEAVDGAAARAALLALRFAGAALVVPLIEELFWRSFLIRVIESNNFESVPVGRCRPVSFIVVAVLFALEHHQLLSGLAAGLAYNLVLCRTKSIAHCVLAHAVTNAALGLWVLYSGQWYFW